MFFPRAMTEIELVVPSNDLLEVTKMIGNEGIFQQVDSAYFKLGQGAQPDAFLARESERLLDNGAPHTGFVIDAQPERRTAAERRAPIADQPR